MLRETGTYTACHIIRHEEARAFRLGYGMDQPQDSSLSGTSWTQKVKVPLTWRPGAAKLIKAEGVCEGRGTPSGALVRGVGQNLSLGT